MDVITTVPWETIGPPGILLLAVLLIIRGDLVPRRTHESIVESKDKALDVERRNSAELRTALRVLAVEHGTTTDKVLSSLPTREEARDA